MRSEGAPGRSTGDEHLPSRNPQTLTCPPPLADGANKAVALGVPSMTPEQFANQRAPLTRKGGVPSARWADGNLHRRLLTGGFVETRLGQSDEVLRA